MSLRPTFLRAAVFAVASAGALSACADLTETRPELSRYGSVAIRSRSTSGTQARGIATGVFFEAYSAAIPNSASAEQQADQCSFSAVDTSTAAVRGQNPAGTALTLSVAGTPVEFPYNPGLLRYETSAGTPFTYTAGTTAQVTIPGSDKFPASTINVKLAEPMVPGPVAVPAVGQPLNLTWNATNDPTSAVLISLRYADPATTTFANAQVFCSVKDDGAYTIPAAGLAGFLASPAARRSLVLTRYRTNESAIDARTFLHIATTADSTVTF